MKFFGSAMYMNEEEAIPKFGITGDLEVEATDLLDAANKVIVFAATKDPKATIVQCEFRILDLDRKIRTAAAAKAASV